jgi:hypothetical protein
MDFIGSDVGGQAPPTAVALWRRVWILDGGRRPRDHLQGAAGAGCPAQVHLPPSFAMIPVWGCSA